MLVGVVLNFESQAGCFPLHPVFELSLANHVLTPALHFVATDIIITI